MKRAMCNDLSLSYLSTFTRLNKEFGDVHVLSGNETVLFCYEDKSEIAVN